ncbi:MAG: SCO family protein [Tumebacillaceae bacterium]
MGAFVKRYWFHTLAGALIALVIGMITWFLWWGTHRLDVMGRSPEFSLTNIDTGKQVTLDSLDGKIKVVAFIYTNCPDACPLTMSSMMQMQNLLKQDGTFGKEVDLISITMDPENDTPAKLQAYEKTFHVDNTGWMTLRGSVADTNALMQGFNIPPIKQANGLISHSNQVFLIDKNRNERTVYDLTQENNVDKMMSDLRTLIAEK